MPTKQEEILAGMAKFIEREIACWTLGRQKPKTLAEVLLRYIKTQGGVLKTDKQLPNEILCEDGSICWVEPLI